MNYCPYCTTDITTKANKCIKCGTNLIKPIHLKANKAGDYSACVGINSGYHGYESYMEGYHTAAEVLLEKIRSTQVPIDITIHPLLFLIHQGLELGLKGLLKENRVSFKRKGVNAHLLRPLLDQLIPYLGAKLSPGATKRLANITSELDKLDYFGMAFRFPEDTNGGIFLRKTQYIDIRQVAKLLTGFDDLQSLFDQ